MKIGSRKTKSAQVAEMMKTQIASGLFVPGEMLESSRALAKKLGVGRQVLRSAIELLEAENLVRSVQGVEFF